MKPDSRSYNADDKDVAVHLSVERNNVTSVARDLGIGSTTLQRWVDLANEHPENPFHGTGNARVTNYISLCVKTAVFEGAMRS